MTTNTPKQFDFTTVTKPTYASADQSSISCMVQFASFPSPIPFTAHASDPEPHGQALWTALTALAYGQIAPYVDPTPTPAEQYTAALALGLVVTSVGTQAIAGTYSVTPSDQNDIVAEVQAIQVLGTFTNGTTTLGWPDATGVPHVFPNLPLFVAFAKAVMLYVTGCKQTYVALASGGTASFPANTALIG